MVIIVSWVEWYTDVDQITSIHMREGYSPDQTDAQYTPAEIRDLHEVGFDAENTERGSVQKDSDGRVVLRTETWQDRQVTQFAYGADGSHVEYGMLTETGDEEKEGRMVERHYEMRDVTIGVNGLSTNGQLFEYGYTKFQNTLARESAEHGGDVPEPSEWFAKVRIDDPEVLAKMSFGTEIRGGTNATGEWKEFQAEQALVDLGITVGGSTYHNRLNKISVDYAVVDGAMKPVKATIRFHGAERAGDHA